MTKIAVLVGSLSQASINKKLARNLEELAPEGTEFMYADLHLPLFDYELEPDFPKEAQALKDVIEQADGVLFVTPEYNRGYTGVLKNAIDWASRPNGTNSFKGKPVGIVGASGGSLGTTQAQQALRNVAVYLDTKLMGQPELYIDGPRTFDETGKVVEASKGVLTKYMAALVDHIESSK